MSSLTQRTKRDFYNVYFDKLKEGGVSSKEAERIISDLIEEMKKLAAGTCPKCGATIARYVNGLHQQGHTRVCGTWVMYRCSSSPPPGIQRPFGACDYMADLTESD